MTGKQLGSNQSLVQKRKEVLNGPNANPRTYTETMNPPSISSVESNSRMMSGTPGANMELANGVRKVMAETNVTAPHFFKDGQLKIGRAHV